MLRIVNFGSAKGGLTTVGYTIYGVLGNVITARSTTGVVEIGTNTGIYAANVLLPGYDAIILWDTGEATPRYATETYQSAIDAISEQGQQVQKIYNSIKNQGEFFALFMDRLGLLEKNVGLQKVNDVNDKVDRLIQRDNISLTNMEEAFNKAAGNIKTIIPEIKIPDYTSTIINIEDKVASLKSEIEKIPKAHKEYGGNFSALLQQINQMQNLLFSKIDNGNNSIKSDVKSNISSNYSSLVSALSKMNEYFEYTKSVFTKFDSILAKIGDLNNKLTSLDSNDKNIIKEREIITAEIQRLNQFIHLISSSQIFKDFQETNNMLYAFGHKR